MIRKFALVGVTVFLFACSQQSKGPAKHYRLTGKILSLNRKDQTASIDAAAIPNYMDAMTMSYPIARKSDFEQLHPGDQIEATVNVYDSGDYDLSPVKKVSQP